MPVAPEIEVILNQVASIGPPPLRDQSVEQNRLNFVSFASALAGEVPELTAVEDRTIPGPPGAPEVPVRVYTPVVDGAGGGPLPVVVFLHGGGWVIGNLDTHDPLCRILADRAGAVVVSVDYRLAPEHPFPAPLDDCVAAVRWVADHAGEVGGDASRLALAGDSAGGNLTAVTALVLRDEGGPALALQVLIYPAIDAGCDTASFAANGEGYLLEADDMRWFWEQYLGPGGDGADPRCSPLRAPDLSRLAPALVITAEFDPLRDEGEAYGARLREAGVPATVSRHDGLIHGFIALRAACSLVEDAVDEVAAALREAFA